MKVLRSLMLQLAILFTVGAFGSAFAKEAVEGNPLEDITEMKRVTFVMKDGIVYKHE